MAINLEARLSFRGDSAIRSLEKLEKQLDTIEKSLRSLDSVADMLDGDFGGVSRAGRSLSNALDDVGTSADKSRSKVNKLVRSLSDVSTGGNKILNVFGRFGGTNFGALGGAALGSLAGPAGAIAGGVVGVAGSAARAALQTTAIAGTAAGAGAAYLSGRALSLSSQNEKALMSFETILGSSGAAEKLMDDLTRFSIDTPFGMDATRDSAKMLLALGTPADELIDRMEAIGNATSAIGGGADQFESIARALSQIESKGKLSAEEMNQLAEQGIGAWSMLSDEMGVSVSALMDAASQGELLADDVLPALYRAFDKNFGGAIERQADTLSGMWDQLKETFDYRLLVRWGDGLSSAISPQLKRLNDWIDSNEDKIERWGDVLERTASQAVNWVVDKFESGFNYVDKYYLSNEKFREMSFTAKVNTIVDDLADKYNEWYNSGGSEKLEGFSKKVSESITSIATNALENLTPALTKAAVSIGQGVVEGILAELDISDIPGFSLVSDLTEKAASYGRDIGSSIWGSSSTSNSGHDYVYGTRSFDIDGSHANGLSYVPYDGYIAELHRGERVLTAEENRDYSGDLSVPYRNNVSTSYGRNYAPTSTTASPSYTFGNIVINGTGYTDKDAQAILRQIVRMVNQAGAAGA